jgi:hypothetical protein
MGKNKTESETGKRRKESRVARQRRKKNFNQKENFSFETEKTTKQKPEVWLIIT